MRTVIEINRLPSGFFEETNPGEGSMPINRQSLRLVAQLCAYLSIAGCSAPEDPIAPPDAASGDAIHKPPTGDDWKPFLTMDWSLPPASEKTTDQDFTADRDYYIAAIKPIDPTGTHHIVILRPGDFHDVLFVSVIGTPALYFPAGKVLHIRAGEKITLQVHRFNGSDKAIEGRSGVAIIESQGSDAFEEVNIFTPAVTTLDLPPGQETTVKGSCTVPSDKTFFAVGPHMHQLGTHIRIAFEHGATTQMLYDRDFSFNEQPFLSMTPPVQAHAGDKITVECTYFNSTPGTVHWGTSTTDEMCQGMLYQFPVSSSAYCTQ
jgi:hypothetical protein